jgi:hypothetical protein
MMILAIAPAIGAKANCIGAATGEGNVISKRRNLIFSLSSQNLKLLCCSILI